MRRARAAAAASPIVLLPLLLLATLSARASCTPDTRQQRGASSTGAGRGGNSRQQGQHGSAAAVFQSDIQQLQSFVHRRSLRASHQQTGSKTDAVHAGTSHAADAALALPGGSTLLYRGPTYANFERPLPEVVEATLFAEFEEYFNQTQDFRAQGPNTYHAEGRQVVVSVPNSRVSGVLGHVFGADGRLLPEFSAPSDLPSVKEALGDPASDAPTSPCKRFPRLASAIQKYGHMYHHFLLEVVPRILLLKPFLGSDTKLLLFGSAHESKWLAQLGIPPEQVETYDPAIEYCADELLVPSLSPIITPPKENFELLRAAFHADAASLEDERDFIIYCSRRDDHERVVSNEDALLAAIKQRFPASDLYVYTGKESAPETIHLFRQASVVIGMHGAGLSHIVFSPPGTAVVEFLFMPDPPLMFWHAAAALQQRYIMVPLAQSWWLERSVTVPLQDVLDALALAFNVGSGACPLGHFLFEASNQCLPCLDGTYRPAGATVCLPCAGGRHATEGAAFCTTCLAGSFSESGHACTLCPEDRVTLFPGAQSSALCIPVGAVEAKMQAMFSEEALTKKLVSLPALEITRPKSASEWIASAVSPSHWQQVRRRRQLQHQYLKELFHSDVQMNALETDSLRRMGQAERRRSLLSSGYQSPISVPSPARSPHNPGYRSPHNPGYLSPSRKR